MAITTKAYRVICGNHRMRDENGKVIKFSKGDVIHTPQDLLADFPPGKFELLTGLQATLGGSDVTTKEDGDLPVETEEGSTAPLEVKHKGFGRYAVINTATGEELNEKPLTKAEAEELAGGGIADGNG